VWLSDRQFLLVAASSLIIRFQDKNMFKLNRWQPSWDGAGITTTMLPITLGIALITSTAAPASAQSVVVQGGEFSFGINHPSGGSHFIYGSPIPTPIPVNPSTGLAPSSTYNSYPNSYPTYNSYPRYNSYPGRSKIVDSTLINPTLVNPRIQNSTLVNPVIVNEPVYRAPLYYPRSRIIYYPYPY
jgi:hypothetical protein